MTRQRQLENVPTQWMPETLTKCDVVKSNKACLWHHEKKARNKNVVNDESHRRNGFWVLDNVLLVSKLYAKSASFTVTA